MYTTQPTTHGKLGPRATKMVFIRYPEHTKRYVMYGGPLNGGRTEVDSCNVDFLEDEFQVLVKSKWI